MITPVTLIVFNRTSHTERVLAQIRRVKPKVLFVVADGPRSGFPADREKCQAVRSLIDSSVDWPCDLVRQYADTNLGCGLRVSSGLDWVFSQAEQSIIVEDDCLLDETFFGFCEELLQRYCEDERVMSISGCNLLDGVRRHWSYFFSRIPAIWGWATWRRAWRHYDFKMTLWPAVRDSHCLESLLPEPRAYAYWTKLFAATHAGKINTWDYQWTFASWINNGLTAVSSSNLVTNIGFDEAGTHTTSDSPFATLQSSPLPFPIVHPPFVLRDVDADCAIQKEIQREQAFTVRAWNRLRRLLR